MANKYFHQFFYSLEQFPVHLFATLQRVGATPATADYNVLNGKGVASFVRTDVGLYTINLDDKYFALLSSQFTLQLAAASGFGVEIVSIDLDAKEIDIRVVDEDGAAAELPNNGLIYCAFVLRNSSK